MFGKCKWDMRVLVRAYVCGAGEEAVRWSAWESVWYHEFRVLARESHTNGAGGGGHTAVGVVIYINGLTSLFTFSCHRINTTTTTNYK